MRERNRVCVRTCERAVLDRNRYTRKSKMKNKEATRPKPKLDCAALRCTAKGRRRTSVSRMRTNTRTARSV